ncbi:hypothetical protein M409DRAFT_25445 [Zasmidium cellare ATCC 36951]|uniref:Fe2OG dioxygenase domain-containing protein n=1 Tax=Zasmidium cellare ATCC 36951 TaxID=1080233 RepID=A0A6A6CD43_ZASCE|nr:uncharacterized protein M409DRAFT_25445 [Zasmidium cellare ATCC 36951]KAF2164098.1 hypothetical protein M409DRAFT_25445 [Zasmidium cellare ATCC 36951]
MAFPVIDIASINEPEAQLSIAKEITEAARTWGFLLLKNHPIPSADIASMFKLGRDFFMEVPEDEKAPYPINDRYVGYNAPLSDRKKDDKASMWLSGKPGFLPSEGRKALPPYWHDKIDTIEGFKHACYDLVSKLLVCFALAMGLEDRNYFAKAHAEDAGNGNQFRMLCYPSRGNAPLKTTTRMSPHSDSGSVTLLFQNCAGLEVESPSDEWVPAPHIENHILVNLGDALAFWSGGQLKATKHRVTFNSVPHDIERMSMAYFGAAAPDTVLEPLKIDGKKAFDKYETNGLTIPPGITVGEYSKMIMTGIYGTGIHKKREEVGAASTVVQVGA